jgi:hypothetical protein
VQKDQSVSEMAEEVLMSQAKALAQRSGQSLEDAHQAVSDTVAGHQLRDLAQGEHRHERAQDWQVSVSWDRAEERLMHHIGSEALSRFVAERHYSWLESYMEWRATWSGWKARKSEHSTTRSLRRNSPA